MFVKSFFFYQKRQLKANIFIRFLLSIALTTYLHNIIFETVAITIFMMRVAFNYFLFVFNLINFSTLFRELIVSIYYAPRHFLCLFYFLCFFPLFFNRSFFLSFAGWRTESFWNGIMNFLEFHRPLEFDSR